MLNLPNRSKSKSVCETDNNTTRRSILKETNHYEQLKKTQSYGPMKSDSLQREEDQRAPRVKPILKKGPTTEEEKEERKRQRKSLRQSIKSGTSKSFSI